MAKGIKTGGRQKADSKVDSSRIWLPTFIPEYEASNAGEIRSTRLQRSLRARLDRKGYLRITVNIDGRRTQRTVHRLVASAHLSDFDSELQVNHINGSKADNRTANLEMVTNQQNVDHARLVLRHKSGARGAKNGNCKLTKENVSLIRLKLSEGKPTRNLAKQFGVSLSYIYKLRNSHWSDNA